jgi:hypothetical protein
MKSDVANLLGVARFTVSRVSTGPPGTIKLASPTADLQLGNQVQIKLGYKEWLSFLNPIWHCTRLGILQSMEYINGGWVQGYLLFKEN